MMQHFIWDRNRALLVAVSSKKPSIPKKEKGCSLLYMTKLHCLLVMPLDMSLQVTGSSAYDHYQYSRASSAPCVCLRFTTFLIIFPIEVPPR
jgi:hypothetical protein